MEREDEKGRSITQMTRLEAEKLIEAGELEDSSEPLAPSLQMEPYALFGDILERFAYPDIRKINIPI